MLKELLSGQNGKASVRLEEIKALKRELRKIENKTNKLLDLVERGVANLNDDTLRNRLSAHNQRRDEIPRLIALKDRERAVSGKMIDASQVRAFAAAVERKLRDPDWKFARAYLRLFMDRIEVDDRKIRIQGPKSALVAAIAHQAETGEPGVSSFVREWRPRQDSNLRPPA